jgi:hypothetical protein
MKMPKPPSPQAELQSERLYRDHLLVRYIQVVQRQGDFIEITPRLADCRRDMTPPHNRRAALGYINPWISS